MTAAMAVCLAGMWLSPLVITLICIGVQMTDFEPISTAQAVREVSRWFAAGLAGVLCLLGAVHVAAGYFA